MLSSRTPVDSRDVTGAVAQGVRRKARPACVAWVMCSGSTPDNVARGADSCREPIDRYACLLGISSVCEPRDRSVKAEMFPDRVTMIGRLSDADLSVLGSFDQSRSISW